MIVLDYLRELKNNEIIVPPFHTGHLGFIPNTTVRVGLIAPYDSNPSHCELIVTPYDPSADLAIVRCTMQDAIGVVRKLISAISSLKINIITQESSSINHQSQHTVNLLLDLSTSSLRKEKTHEFAKQKYRDFDYVFPLSDYRLLKIFERIIAYCGDTICWENQNGDYRIQLYLAPLEKKVIQSPIPVNIESANSRNCIKIKLPLSLVNRITTNLNPDSNENGTLKYLLFSDTKERTLRIYFPKVDSWKRLVHIAIYHKDTPGALSSIFDLLANADFNIITGLLRKNQQDTNIWEGLLEFKGADTIDSTDLFKWVIDKIKLSNRNLDYDISRYDFRVGPPLYPSSKKKYEPLRIEISAVTRFLNKEEDIFVEKIEETMAKLESMLDQELYYSQTLDLIRSIRTRNKRDFKQRIFLSYPSGARKHADHLRKLLETHYYMDEYQDAKGENILDEVMRKIKACDFFLGIWHHDERMPIGKGTYSISPWMPFEYGVALTEGKQTYLVRSEKVDEKVWKRINPSRAIPAYDDFTFVNETAKIVEAFVHSKLKDH